MRENWVGIGLHWKQSQYLIIWDPEFHISICGNKSYDIYTSLMTMPTIGNFVLIAESWKIVAVEGNTKFALELSDFAFTKR